MYSRTPGLIRFLSLVAVIAALSGCGGGSSGGEPQVTRAVRGPGFLFRVPAGRAVERTDRAVIVQPLEEESVELESVSRFPLVKPFRPSLWPRVVTELDGVAAKLASGLSGELVSSEDVRAGGRRARRYEITYSRGGADLRQRITFVFRRREELQLLCRYVAADTPPPACTLLEQTFRIV